jgi:hypothetical protein
LLLAQIAKPDLQYDIDSDAEDEYVPNHSIETVAQRQSTRKRAREATDEGAPSEGLRSAKKRLSDSNEA